MKGLVGLPREKRDTLFLLGVLTWTVLPHFQHLPAWTTAFAIALLGWRAALALRGAALPGRWIVIAALVAATLGIAATEHTLFGRSAGVSLLVVLMALKTLELSARRDAMVVFFLGFFLVLTNFLFSQSLAVAIAMLLSVWGLLTALTLAHMPNGHPPLADAARVAGRAALLGAPVMVLLFLLFPRIGPLWAAPSDGAARTGLGDSLAMGSIAEIASDDAVALRLRFTGPQPAPSELYFRGPVLSRFDGERWEPSSADASPRLARPAAAEMRLAGPSIAYEMTLEPAPLAVLPLLELTPQAPRGSPALAALRPRMDESLEWRTDRPISTRVRFDAEAWLRYEHGPAAAALWLRDDVSLPPGYNPRVLAWAAALRRDPRYAEAGSETLAALLLAEIRRKGFVYTMAPGLYGRDAVDEFWFDRRQGFCEHFAAAFVVLMRALDVPARVVTGYQGADPLPVDGYLVVRHAQAHAWAEYWSEGRGWVRADPTAAIAPERVMQGRLLAPQRGFVAGAIDAVDPELLHSLRDLFDLVDDRWNQWVLDYSRQRQFQLLEALGVQSPGWPDLAFALIAVATGGAIAAALWAWADRRRRDPAERLRARLGQALGRIGVPFAEHDTPRALAARVRRRYGAAGEALVGALEALERDRYARGGKPLPDRRWWRSLDAAVGRVRAARST